VNISLGLVEARHGLLNWTELVDSQFPAAIVLLESMAEKSSPYSILVASSLGTVVATLVGNPFDVVKTRQMLGAHQYLRSALGLLIHTEGKRVLLSGMRPALISGVAGNACYFLLYESLKDRATAGVGQLGYGVTAFFSRAAAVALLTPVEVLRTRAYAGTSTAEVLVYRGLQAQVWRDVIWSSVFWQVYETSLPSDPSSAATIASAVIGGITASVLTHPLDFLKTKLQLDYSLGENPLQGLQHLWTSERTRMFTQGLTAHCLKSAVNMSVFIVLYTHLRSIFSNA